MRACSNVSSSSDLLFRREDMCAMYSSLRLFRRSISRDWRGGGGGGEGGRGGREREGGGEGGG